jgi:hypothetical protein
MERNVREKQMFRMHVRSLSVALVVLGLGCSGITVNSDYDPATDFTPLRSFAWIESQGPAGAPPGPSQPLFDQRVRNAVDDSLSQRGMKKVDRAAADFLVQYYISVDKKLQVDTNSYGYGYGGYGYGGRGYSNTTVREYDEGTLLLDFVDPIKKELVWRGSGTTRIRSTTTPEEREKRVRDVVTKILEQYPPAR